MKYQKFKHFCTERLLKWGLHSDHFVELSAMLVAHESLGKNHESCCINQNRRRLPSEDFGVKNELL